MNAYVWDPTPEFTEHGNIAAFCRRHGIDGGYRALQARSAADPPWFWERALPDIGIVWHTPPTRVCDDTGGIAFTRWFPGGRTNLVDSCLHRHQRQRRGQAPALRWEREDGSTGVLTYDEVAARSARVAGGLRALGVVEGDRVAGYLPPGPEAFVLLFACAHIGAVLVPLFSGFGAEAIAVRLVDAGARVLVTAAAVTRHGRRHDMQTVARTALEKATCVRRLVVVPEEPGTPRDASESWPSRAGDVSQDEPTAPPGPTTTTWHRLADAEPAETVSLPADAPFLLLHTSGTTGRPKGAIHTHGGFPAQVGSETRYNLDLRPDDVACWVTDPGWIMFPLVAVGATLAGASVLAYEGAIDHPDVTRLWRLLDDHRVTVFGSSPSLSRMLMGRDPQHPAAPSRLRLLASTGEPWTEAAWRWYFADFGGKRCPVINICGGTEVGGSLLASAPTLPQSPGSFSGPCLGIDAAIEDDQGTEPPEGQVGELVVRRSWPGMTRGLWRARERFAHTYFGRRPGRWSHGDLVSRTGEEWFVHGRLDDVIKLAGKRLGPAEVEDAVVGDPAVAEAAAVGIPHPVKGEALWCFAVPAAGRTLGAPEAERIRARVADALGAAFRPGRVVAVPELPRTRNGKVMRRLIRSLVTGEAPGDLSTLVNPACLDAIRTALQDQ
ncbi:AMP-binding protein [Streptomyces sp. NBC_01373]|uniref:AMP-binding protein n=1 Tax=Streptomyces sp. NBC_01373 TaxID=2903843 RepID=UPI00225254B0|nr:AMP-binding protein [Streptomyces sp. NBC_01373]MCX4706076.1 AMP-binding protein [Streptomyces sp. NBC_01373]